MRRLWAAATVVATATAGLGSGRPATAAPNVVGPIRQFGTSANDSAQGVALDGVGNAVVVGRTFGTLPGSLDISAGGHDAFVAKYGANGARIWVHQLGTSSTDEAHAVAVDASGNAYVAGLTFAGMPGALTASNGGVEAWLAKYSPAGARLWVQQLGSTGYDVIESVAIVTGGVVVAGRTNGAIPSAGPASGAFDAFVAKFGTTGVLSWVRQVGSSVDDDFFGVATDSAGNAYAAGHSNGTLPGSVESSAGSGDVVVVKYATDGTRTWTHQLGSSAFDQAYGIAADSAGNTYVTGYTASTLPGSLDANLGSNDAFVARYSAAGARSWVRQLGAVEGARTDTGRAVAVNGSRVVVTGEAGGTLSGSIDATAGSFDSYLAEFTTAGVRSEVRQLGSPQADRGFGVAADPAGVVVAGQALGTLAGSPQAHAGAEDAFVTRYATDASITVPLSALESTRLDAIAAYLGTDRDGALRTGVLFIAFLDALSARTAPTPAPVDAPVPPLLNPAEVVAWTAPDSVQLGNVMGQYQLSGADSMRLGFNLLSFILALGGH